ncbi:MAG: helix-turn-helix transcriptional regulator [Firmicutes bacterium]|nr:helix-turn-helix transcriptional regulator [Bacillota bacterium]
MMALDVFKHVRETVETFSACTSLPAAAISGQGDLTAYAGETLPHALAVNVLQQIPTQIMQFTSGTKLRMDHIAIPVEGHEDLQVIAVPLVKGSFMQGMYIIGPFSKTHLQTCVHYLIELLRSIEGTGLTTSLQFPANLHVRRAVRYVHQHYSEPLSLESMAEYLGINKCYLANVFRSEMGETFIEFVNRFRVEASKQALRETDEPILNIALQHGFTSQNYYARVFKKLTGVTPSEFRRQAKLQMVSLAQ